MLLIWYIWYAGIEVTEVACCATGMFEMGYACARNNMFTCTNADKYVFWDAFHPTQKTNQIIANYLMKNVFSVFHWSIFLCLVMCNTTYDECATLYAYILLAFPRVYIYNIIKSGLSVFDLDKINNGTLCEYRSTNLVHEHSFCCLQQIWYCHL